jgi:hypothetical protein
MSGPGSLTDFLLPRSQIAVRLVLTQGDPLEGTIFVGERVPQHDGPETPIEMLNRPESFFPFRPDDGGAVLLVSKRQTVAVAGAPRPGLAPGPRAALDPDRLSAAKELNLELELTNGDTLAGLANVELPEHQSRPLDYLNASAEPFFAISTPEGTHYVNRAHVLFARPRD